MLVADTELATLSGRTVGVLSTGRTTVTSNATLTGRTIVVTTAGEATVAQDTTFTAGAVVVGSAGSRAAALLTGAVVAGFALLAVRVAGTRCRRLAGSVVASFSTFAVVVGAASRGLALSVGTNLTVLAVVVRSTTRRTRGGTATTGAGGPPTRATGALGRCQAEAGALRLYTYAVDAHLAALAIRFFGALRRRNTLVVLTAVTVGAVTIGTTNVLVLTGV